MRRSTVSIIQGTASNTIEVKLGDMFFINSELKTYNNNELYEFRPVVSIIVAIRQHDKKVWLFSACVDRSQYHISRVDENKISLISGRKETTFNINDIKNLLLNKTFPIKALGIRIYGVIISTSPKLMSQMDMIKINARMPDVSKWPIKAVDIWAKRQHNLKNQELLPIVKKCSVADGNKLANLILLAGIIKKQHSSHIKEKQNSTQHMSDKLEVIMRHLQNMRIWYSFDTRFIKIYLEEVIDGSIKFKHDFSSENLLYYSVLIINNCPAYILVRPDECSDSDVDFKFTNGVVLHCKVLSFTMDNFKGALKRLNEDERNNCSLSIPIVQDGVVQDWPVDPYNSPTTPDPGLIIEHSDNNNIFTSNELSFTNIATNNLAFSTTDLRAVTVQNTQLTVNTDDQIVYMGTTELRGEPTEAEEPEVATEEEEEEE